MEIYKEEVGGFKVFRCPFCDVKPLGSDIRFRKHLKTHHPTQKTLLRDSPRTALATTATLPGLQMFFPKPGLGDLEVEQPGVKQHLAELEEEDDEEFYLSPEGRLGESLDSLEAGEIVYHDRKGEEAEELVDEHVCGVCAVRRRVRAARARPPSCWTVCWGAPPRPTSAPGAPPWRPRSAGPSRASGSCRGGWGWR